MVNKIIADYLKVGKRLVIPQFGAFIHKDTDGGVVFVPFLKKDDGVLASQLSATYGLSNEEAYGVITEYIAQVQKSVADRGSFVVEGVGALCIDSNGVCYLEYNARAGVGQTVRTGASAPVTEAPSRPAVAPAASQPAAAPTPVAQPRPVQPVQATQSAQPVQSTQPVQPAQPVQPMRPQASQPTQCPPPAQPTPQPRQATPPIHPAQPYPGQPQQTAPRGQMPPVPPTALRRPAQGSGTPAKGTDKFLIIAIIAAIIALGAIIYGVVTSVGDGPKIAPMELPVHERPAVLDSIQKQDSIRAVEAAKSGARSKR